MIEPETNMIEFKKENRNWFKMEINTSMVYIKDNKKRNKILKTIT